MNRFFARRLRHGLKWYEIHFNWYTIWIFKQVGLVPYTQGVSLLARTYANPS